MHHLDHQSVQLEPELYCSEHYVVINVRSFLKIIINLCRVSAGLALGKATVNGAGAVTVAFLCRVPPGLSAKPLPSAALDKEHTVKI